jgi:SAM-dependent methyltransferase
MFQTPRVGETRLSVCPICDGHPEPWRTKSTSFGLFPIDTCSSCGFGFVNPRPSSAFLMGFYAISGHARGDPSEAPVATMADIVETESNFPNSTLDASRMVRTISRILADRTRNYRFLDVGCGFGFFSREAREAGFEVTAIELASHEREVATQMTGVAPHAECFEDFEAEPKTFSAILMSQILEHAQDVNLWVSKANNLLVPRGVLAIALPNFDSIFRRLMQENEPFVCPPAHLNFFTRTSLKTLLERHGFRVTKTQWTSRIRPSAIDKRIPRMARRAVPILGLGSKAILKAVDGLHLGQILTIYAEKEGDI